MRGAGVCSVGLEARSAGEEAWCSSAAWLRGSSPGIAVSAFGSTAASAAASTQDPTSVCTILGCCDPDCSARHPWKDDTAPNSNSQSAVPPPSIPEAGATGRERFCNNTEAERCTFDDSILIESDSDQESDHEVERRTDAPPVRLLPSVRMISPARIRQSVSMCRVGVI